MTRTGKMQFIREAIEARKGFQRVTHASMIFDGFEIGYYISDKDYFHFKYKDVTVNVNGSVDICAVEGVNIPPLDRLIRLDVDEWIDEVVNLIKESQKEITIEGKRYRLIEV